MGKNLSIRTREKIIELYKNGYGYKKISQKTSEKVPTIKKIVRKYNKFGTIENLKEKVAKSVQL